MYIDDVLLFSKNEEEQFDHLKHFLSLLDEARVKRKKNKCFLFQ